MERIVINTLNETQWTRHSNEPQRTRHFNETSLISQLQKTHVRTFREYV